MGNLWEKLKLGGRWLENHTGYTVCMDEHEQVKGLFRICDDDSKAVECYKKYNQEIKKIRVKGIEYAICARPDAVKAWKDKDYERHKA